MQLLSICSEKNVEYRVYICYAYICRIEIQMVTHLIPMNY